VLDHGHVIERGRDDDLTRLGGQYSVLTQRQRPDGVLRPGPNRALMPPTAHLRP
jgi:hypothetical protein